MQHIVANTTVNIFPIIKCYRNNATIDNDLFLSSHKFLNDTPPTPHKATAFLLYIYMGLIRIPLATQPSTFSAAQMGISTNNPPPFPLPDQP